MRTPLAILAVAVLIAGCSAAPQATQPSTTPPTPSITTPAAATPEQLASIIAGDEKGWREVIDGAFDCRYLWVMESKDADDETNATSCYLRESTIVMSAVTAGKELQKLTPPASMESLVSDTLSALATIGDVDLEGACGDPFDGPNDTDECSTAQGSLMTAYTALETVLDKWQPYTG